MAKSVGFLPFKQAREIARALKLRNNAKWKEWAKDNARSYNVPVSPQITYKGEWINWYDWLGNSLNTYGEKASRYFLPFEEARKYVAELGFTKCSEWVIWCKGGNRPANIPSLPNQTYKDEWVDWHHWLSASDHPAPPKFLPFVQAREFVRSIGLSSTNDWWNWVASGARPRNVPAHPKRVYTNEWVSWVDWIRSDGRKQQYHHLPFKRARELARSIGFKNKNRWIIWANSSARPSNIPTRPDRTYGNEWAGWHDWLGHD